MIGNEPMDSDELSMPEGNEIKKVKKYMCHHYGCGKSFCSNFSLVRHLRTIHEGQRAFTCPHCPKSFTQKQHMKEHLKTHENKKRSQKCLIKIDLDENSSKS